ncbi:fasciclin domain-containing protein [Spirosoma soli]|uniref:Fasciclin domain-containing protein n=1 Tax=Spirosoma soli TaxID=1770529 RepID=A0ABW5M750_9BACT
MFKQSACSLALSFVLLTGAAFTAVGQTTNTMPTQSGTSTSSPTSQSSSGMSSASGSSMGASTGKDLAASAGLSPDHTTLLQALQAAGLAERAKGAGPYTIFAPTNDAFSKLPSGTLDNLLKPESKQKLTSILTTHVVQGSLKAADLKDGQTVKTVSGETLTVSKQGGSVMIKDAKGGSATVTTPDIQATNGIVHSIDTVLMPSK